MSGDFRDQLQAALGGAYTVERELGGGGMSRVFAAEERSLGRRVVIKVLPPELSSTVSADRFRREIQLAASLHHPHIVPLLGAGEAERLLYYTMPLIEGESVRERLKREKQLPLEDALRIAREVADALDYAHRHDILHRDIKPENILLEDEHALVADFGIARAVLCAGGGDMLTSTGLTLGTPTYMSPEQASGEREIDARSDLYSLGCVLYEMLAGEPPFIGPTAQAAIARRFREPVPSLHSAREAVPISLERAIAKALALAPADRFPTARAFAQALEASGTRARSAKRAKAAAADSRPAERVVARARRMRERISTYVGVSVLALLAVYGGWTRLARGRNPAADIGERTAVVASTTVSRSVAVLPLVNMSGDPANEYFSDGMTEELINALTKIPGLHVAARTSAFALKGKDLDVRTIGDTLGVSTVLEGSVRKVGSRLRITAQLVDAVTGYHLWSETYDRELTDVFAVQDDIARAIARTLEIKLATARKAVLISHPTESVEAYNLYLKGRYFWNKRTKDGFQRAIQYFREAIRADSGFALAYAGMADAYALLGGPSYNYLPPAQAFARAKAAARRALELDSSLAEPHATLGLAATNYDWDWASAEREFKRAIDLKPDYPTAHHWYALYLAATDQLDEATREIGRAQELDPLSLIITVEVGRIMYFARRYDQALAELRKARELDPGFPRGHLVTAMVFLQQKKYEQAIAELHAVGEPFGGYTDAVLGYAYAAAGKRTEARGVLARLGARARHDRVPPVFIALVHTALGDRERAMEWLERSYQERSGPMRDLKVHPMFDPLRSDPRFVSLLRRMGLLR